MFLDFSFLFFSWMFLSEISEGFLVTSGRYVLGLVVSSFIFVTSDLALNAFFAFSFSAISEIIFCFSWATSSLSYSILSSLNFFLSSVSCFLSVDRFGDYNLLFDFLMGLYGLDVGISHGFLFGGAAACIYSILWMAPRTFWTALLIPRVLLLCGSAASAYFSWSNLI